MIKITVTYKSKGKDIKVEVECNTALIGWPDDCAKKVKEAVDAMEKVFPPDAVIGDKR